MGVCDRACEYSKWFIRSQGKRTIINIETFLDSCMYLKVHISQIHLKVFAVRQTEKAVFCFTWAKLVCPWLTVRTRQTALKNFCSLSQEARSCSCVHCIGARLACASCSPGGARPHAACTGGSLPSTAAGCLLPAHPWPPACAGNAIDLWH